MASFQVTWLRSCLVHFCGFITTLLSWFLHGFVSCYMASFMFVHFCGFIITRFCLFTLYDFHHTKFHSTWWFLYGITLLGGSCTVSQGFVYLLCMISIIPSSTLRGGSCTVSLYCVVLVQYHKALIIYCV